MRFRLLHDWIAIEPRANDLSGRATVLAVGEDIDEVEPGDVVLVDPDAGYPIALNGRGCRIIDRQGLVGVVTADDEYDADMRPLPRRRRDDDEADEDGGRHATA